MLHRCCCCCPPRARHEAVATAAAFSACMRDCGAEALEWPRRVGLSARSPRAPILPILVRARAVGDSASHSTSIRAGAARRPSWCAACLLSTRGLQNCPDRGAGRLVAAKEEQLGGRCTALKGGSNRSGSGNSRGWRTHQRVGRVGVRGQRLRRRLRLRARPRTRRLQPRRRTCCSFTPT